MAYKIFTAPNNSTKTAKSFDRGVYSPVQYWAHHDIGGVNVCAWASPECIRGCLDDSGRMVFKSVKEAHLRRKMLFIHDRSQYWRDVLHDINYGIVKAYQLGMEFACRMNGTQDMPWERIPVVVDGKRYANSIMEMYSSIQFYDYTKYPIWKRRESVGRWPENYDLTFSRSEVNHNLVMAHLHLGYRVAAVFPDDNFPDTWKGYKVISQVEDDFTYKKPHGTILGLCAKGKAKKDTSGFVIREVA
jgi:hypothetical protein